MVNLTYPGVYIDEIEPGAPIEGVGTNVAAFLGPLGDGPPNEAHRITSLDAFKARYGKTPLPGAFHTWYAVRGFFENGGTVCYVVRVSTAAAATTGPIVDQTGQDAIVVSARATGAQAGYTVDVDDSIQLVTGRSVARPKTAANTNASGTQITTQTLADAALFVTGDRLSWTGLSAADKPVVLRVSGKTITLQAPLSAAYPNVKVGLADLVAGTDSDFRVGDRTNIESGTVLTITQGAATTSVAVVDYVLPVTASDGSTTYRVYLRSPLLKTYGMGSAITLASTEFQLQVNGTGGPWKYTGLSMDASHPNFFKSVVGAADGLWAADFAQPPSTSTPPENRPKTKSGIAMAGGSDDNPAAITSANYQAAVDLLRPIDNVNMVTAPGRFDKPVQLALINHCELLWDRFAILDSRPGAPMFDAGSVDEQRWGLNSPKGFAALYYPWLIVEDDAGTGTVTVPPSGHMAGVYARTDDTRGVHKAPAGEDAVVAGALGVDQTMSDIDHGQLNLDGIDVIRVFRPGGTPVVWGARTIASDTNWRYVNIRRLFLYLEESIQDGIDWAVFEPNNPSLWQKLKRTITAFLTSVWRDGALDGTTAEEAFYVRIDDALNPESEKQLGRLYVEIGIRPSYPAEFIVVRIGIWPGGAQIIE